VAKMIDALSIPLLEANATGQILDELILTVFDVTGSSPTLIGTYKFEDVFVSSVSLGASTASSISENSSFAYGKITSTITLNGTTYTSCYDIINNKKC